MTKYHGKRGAVEVGAGSTAVMELEGWTLDVQTEVAQAYAMGEDWQTSEATVSSWTGSLTTYYDPADAGQLLLVAGAEIALNLYPNANASGQPEFSGTAIISGEPLTGSKDGYLMRTVNFTGDGALTRGTVT